jgi:hypothetical protein
MEALKNALVDMTRDKEMHAESLKAAKLTIKIRE